MPGARGEQICGINFITGEAGIEFAGGLAPFFLPSVFELISYSLGWSY